jgi:hypothetical protein
LNDGRGRFIDASARLPTDDVSNALAVIDLNGDGAPDILTGNVGTDRVLINDGEAHFRDATRERWPQSGTSRTQDIELADVDGDGDLDVIVANEGQNELFVNDNGRLVDETTSRLPELQDESREIRAVDVDGDPDILAPSTDFSATGAGDYLALLNDGRGRFTAAGAGVVLPQSATGNGFDVEVADFDGDGRVELLLCNRASGPTAARSGGVLRLLVRE